MNNNDFIIPVKIDAALFRSFALFDTFYVKRRWVSPALFAGIMSSFSAIAFSRIGKSEQAALLGIVLLGVGILLPAVYFLFYFLSLREQITKRQLTKPKLVYTVSLNRESGVQVSTSIESATYRWDELYACYRTKNSIYIYATPTKAYLLPKAQIPQDEGVLWHMLCTLLTANKCHDKIKI